MSRIIRRTRRTPSGVPGRDAPPGTDQIFVIQPPALACLRTSYSGDYSITLPAASYDYIEILIYPESKKVAGASGNQYGVEVNLSLTPIGSPTPIPIVRKYVRGSITVDYTIGNTAGRERAFWVYDAAITARDFQSSLPIGAGGRTTLDFNIVGTSFTNPANEVANINSTDYQEWDTVVHEYGHTVQMRNGFFPFSWDQYMIGRAPLQHHLGVNVRLDHPTFSFEKQRKLAFSEGFADFFSVIAQKEAGVSNPALAGAGDGALHGNSAEDGTPLQLPINPTDGNSSYSGGEDEELTVMRILWDLYDSANAADTMSQLGDQTILDNVKMGYPALFKMIMEKKPLTLQDLWHDLYDRATADNSTNRNLALINYGGVFQLNNVSPRPSGFRVGGNYTTSWSASAAPVPTFVWQVPKGSPAAPGPAGTLLTDFALMAFDTAGNRLSSTWMTGAGTTPNANGVCSWVADADTIQDLKAHRGEVKWVVVGCQGKDNATSVFRDTYWSFAKSFTVVN